MSQHIDQDSRQGIAVVGTMLAMLLAIVAVVVIGRRSTLPDVTTAPLADSTVVTNTETSAGAGTQVASGQTCDGNEDMMTDQLNVLPIRAGEREKTTGSVPHIQLDANPVPEVDEELRRRVYLLPGVVEQESRLSLPGARSLSLSDEVEAARPEMLQAGREFGHIHPDGSLHIWLPVDRALEVQETKWGELHPWVTRDNFWDGVVMVYTPESPDELEVVLRLVVDSYNFVIGADVDPAALC